MQIADRKIKVHKTQTVTLPLNTYNEKLHSLTKLTVDRSCCVKPRQTTDPKKMCGHRVRAFCSIHSRRDHVQRHEFVQRQSIVQSR